LDWTTILDHGLTAAASGGASFLGAFFRFKQRLKACEDALTKLSDEVPRLRRQYEIAAAGWRAELDAFRADIRRELQHQQQLVDMRAKELAQMHQDIEKLKERGSRYVRSDAFASFTKSQEDQWKEMARTLGRLEGMLK
jgi:hypothetical protein